MNQNLFTQLFKISITISLIFKAIQLLVRIFNIAILNFVLSGNDNYRSKLQFIFQEILIETKVNYITVIFFIIFLSIWFYLKYKKAHETSTQKLSYKPIWALFAFIIPIFNLIAPYRIMNELLTVYNKDMSLESWGKNQIKIWWFLSITLFAFSHFIRIKFNQVDNLQTYLSLEYFSLVLFAVTIHYYLLLQKLVKLVSD